MASRKTNATQWRSRGMPAGDRLSVLLLVNDLRIGGAERQVVELARCLSKERFDTTVVTLYPGGALEGELLGGGDVRLVSLDRRHKFDFAGPLRHLATLLRSERVDVIQPFLTPSTFFGLSAALWARTPVKIVTERCGVRRSAGLGSNVYRFVEDQLTRFADAAVPNSMAGRDYLISRGVDPRKVRVVYNGISSRRTGVADADARAAREAIGVPPDACTVGIVASLEPAKDHETFLLAAREVLACEPNVHFVIVGDGVLRQRLEARSADLGIGGRAHFTASVDAVAPYVAIFDVAVLSSCDNEGCSNALLEAMALAKPVVATDVGGNSELVIDGETGYVVPPRDPARLARAIVTVLSDRDRARSMGERARAQFERRFTVERMVGEYEALYTELRQRRATTIGAPAPGEKEAGA